MNRNLAFRRKVVYLCVMAVLLIPLYIVGAPQTRRGEEVTGGGKLAQMRSKYKLSQGDLGEIDPGGEAMKLAMLGMQGVAVNVLWTQSNHYKKTEQYDKMLAASKQISKLQPNFISVWEFQAHNISYNTSVEFDDYRLRYHWIKKGIDYLIEGTRYNREEPKLLWSLGWFFNQKIGRSDEHRQFRPMFSDDEDWHRELRDVVAMENTIGPDGARPDNWLVGYQWMLKAQRMVDNTGKPVKGKTGYIFHSSPAMALMYYAIAIEEEGYLDEKGQNAWRQAGEAWEEYGKRDVRTSSGLVIQLGELEETEKRAKQFRAQLLDLVPQGREELLRERIAELDPQQRGALLVKLNEDVAAKEKEIDQAKANLERINADLDRLREELGVTEEEAADDDVPLRGPTYRLRVERIRLYNDYIQKAAEQINDLRNQLEEATLHRDLVEADPNDRLSKEQVEELTDQERYAYYSEGERVLTLSNDLIADQADPGDLERAWELATELSRYETRATFIKRYQDVVNFDYWKTRAEVEQTLHAVRARDYLYQADQAFRDRNDLNLSRELYDNAWDLWAVIFDVHPELLDDTTAEDLMAAINSYIELLDQRDEQNLDENGLPKDFKLNQLVEIHKTQLERGRRGPDDAPGQSTDEHGHGNAPDEFVP
jgi:hypothetical protein